MKAQVFNKSKLRLPVFLALALSASLALAEAPMSEPAVKANVKDASVKWGGCPDFLPKGCGLAVLHGDAAKPNSDVFFKVPGKSHIAHHSHTSAERMILVSGKLALTYDGQKEMIINEGEYTYGPAKLGHEGTCLSKKPCVLFIAFESPIDAEPDKAAK